MTAIDPYALWLGANAGLMVLAVVLSFFTRWME